MNTRTETKRGRKPKSPADKPAQLTVRLEPETLFGLEVVARDRRTSLSGAAEYLLSQQLKSYERVTGKIDETPRVLAEMLKDIPVQGVPMDLPSEERVEMIIRVLLKSEAGRALFMPAALQVPSERYFYRLFWKLSDLSKGHEKLSHLFAKAMVLPNSMQQLYEASKVFERKGYELDDAAEQYLKLAIGVNQEREAKKGK